MPKLKIMLPKARRMRPTIEFTIRYFAAFKKIYTAITAIIAKIKIMVSTAINIKLNLMCIIVFCIGLKNVNLRLDKISGRPYLHFNYAERKDY